MLFFFSEILIHVINDFPVSVSFFAVLRAYFLLQTVKNVLFFEFYIQAVANICWWVLAVSHSFYPL